RYLPDRQLPDKAVSVLDTACARLALGQNATPAAIEDATRRCEDIEVQMRVLQRELAVGTDHSERLQQLQRDQEKTKTRLEDLGRRYTEERDLVSKIRDIRTRLEQATSSPQVQKGSQTDGGAAQPAYDLPALRSELVQLNDELERVQGEAPLIRV